MQRRTFMQSALVGGIAAAAPTLWAQAKYPSKPITFVVPFAAGGGGDTVARVLAKSLSERINNPVIVENRVGAGGNIGTAFVLQSPPNGYTLLNMSSTYPIQAAVSKLPFDPVEDMQPIIMVSRDPAVVIVHPESPLRNAKDLAEAAKRTPSKLTYGSAGVGSIAHLGMEELAFNLGVQLVHVPYKGSSQAFNDVLGKSVDMMLTSATFATPYIKSGRVRALGIAGDQRTPTLPDVPTFAEQGYPAFQVVDWKAVAGPKGLPADVVAFLNRELNEVLKQKALAEKFEAEGTTVVGGTPEQMMQIVRADIERWKNLVTQAKVRIE
ncbi:MAG: tripartite tricarboxylate transporter substrate binding protein [Burkholderiales bacterium]